MNKHNKTKVICHLSNLRYRKDLRILIRECRSLARVGYQVHYIVADGQGPEVIDGVQIHDVGLRQGFPWRFVRTHAELKAKAIKLQADLYHFHDPELMWLGRQLKQTGAKVIADIQEDVPMELADNIAKSKLRRVTSSRLITWLEKLLLPACDAVITASPKVEARFSRFLDRVITIGCFPDLREEFAQIGTLNPTQKTYDLVYSGSISQIRGIVETVAVLEETNWSFLLLGDFQSEQIESKIRGSKAWDTQIHYAGFLHDRQAIADTMQQARIGMATPLPNRNFATTYLLKIFEYMALGIPVVASNFPFWQEILDEYQSGVTVDSTDPEAIRSTIQHLLDRPEEIQRMGDNGRRAIEEKYNWAQEETKLLALYAQLLAE